MLVVHHYHSQLEGAQQKGWYWPRREGVEEIDCSWKADGLEKNKSKKKSGFYIYKQEAHLCGYFGAELLLQLELLLELELLLRL